MRPTSKAGNSEARAGTPAPRPSRERSGREAGFTLVETLAVLGVLALGAMLVTPSVGFGTSQARLGMVAAEIATALTEARTQAIITSRETVVLVDADRGALVAGPRRVDLPSDVDLGVVVAGTCRQEGRRIGITFGATGRSCGAALRLVRGDRGFRIRVGWYSGHVEIERI